MIEFAKDKDLILQETPLFAVLSRQERALIKERSNIIEYRKGQVIYQEGTPPGAFYCVIIGRVIIYTQGPSGNENILEYLHRGKYFGIISLLTGEPHSVTAKAMNDCLLLTIKKEDFDYILKKVPGLAIDLSQTLSRRLKNKDIHRKIIFESTIISVFSSYSQAGKTVYALNLALSLKQETGKSVVILDICQKDKTHSLPRRFGLPDDYPAMDLPAYGADVLRIIGDFLLRPEPGIGLICFYYNPEEESCAKKLAAVLSALVNDYHYIILDLPSEMDACVFSILNQSDLIHLITSPDAVDLKRTRHLIERLKEEFNFPPAKIKVVTNEYKFSKLSPQEQIELLGEHIFATLPKIEMTVRDKLVLEEPDSEYARAVRRISRQVGERLVGLALGVGVGYGFCHIGVLKVIEEEKTPVDIISGASIGAVIAALWATGRSAREILEIAREFKEPKYIWGLVDLTIPSLGFIKGKKLYKFLRKHFGSRTFYDVRLPLKIIASDVRRKEPRVLDKGPLVDALMASCSMPGVFRPFRFKEGILFDGGIINPLPTEVLFKAGARKIIAVNVTPSREDMLHRYESLKEQFTAAYAEIKKRKWFSLKGYLRDKFKTNILGIVFNSIEVMQSELIQQESQLADIVLHPDTSGLHWLELHRALEFAKRGEEEARRHIDKIRQVVNE
ncbi:MAG: patatin-like phospholipase family protein [Candidatus Omnitrophota bacterium]|jgi:NTE family protein